MASKLPEFCYGTLPSTGQTIIIERGKMGYVVSGNQATAEELNEGLGVTKAQAEAMLVGSMFGWETEGADPDRYDQNGKPLKLSSEFVQ